MVKKIKIHYQLIYLVITTSKVITRFNKEIIYQNVPNFLATSFCVQTT